jgi:predicted metal-dependent phosphoesterase TrpH
MTSVQGRADLHIHTMASDGTAGVAQVLARAEEARLDVIAITDHDRIDAAKAAQAMALKNKLRARMSKAHAVAVPKATAEDLKEIEHH